MPKGIPRALDDQCPPCQNASERSSKQSLATFRELRFGRKAMGQRLRIGALQGQPVRVWNICHNLGELRSSEIVL